MGSSNAHRKRPTEFTRKAIGKRAAWYEAYKHHNLSNIITGKIPKIIRAIDSAKARLKKARTEKAADVECRHLERSLLAINDSYTKIKNILREGYVWTHEFYLLWSLPFVPNLYGAVSTSWFSQYRLSIRQRSSASYYRTRNTNAIILL